MPHLYTKGRLQCVTTLVSFTDRDGKPYVLLGRSDPRYRDFEGKCLKGESLPVGAYMFIGGHADYIAGKHRADWNAGDPQLAHWPSHINQRVAACAMKELGEEANLSVEAMDGEPSLAGLLKKATLRYLATQHHIGRGDVPTDVHFLHLDLGMLSPLQIAAFERTIAPGDDLIQTSIIPADKLYRDTRGALVAIPEQLHTKTKTEFNGFTEMAEWRSVTPCAA